MHAIRYAALIGALYLFFAGAAYAEDSEASRRTLKGLTGVYVIVEEFQPNLLKYEKYTTQFGPNKESCRQEVERKLKEAGMRAFSAQEWQKTPGRPVLYVNVNTHETEKYWFSYDIKLELRQRVVLEAHPEIKVLADTWSLNVTGMTNIGNLKQIRQDLGRLLTRFIQGWKNSGSSTILESQTTNK